MLISQRVKAVVNWYKAALSQARAQELSKVVDGEYMLLTTIKKEVLNKSEVQVCSLWEITTKLFVQFIG